MFDLVLYGFGLWKKTGKIDAKKNKKRNQSRDLLSFFMPGKHTLKVLKGKLHKYKKYTFVINLYSLSFLKYICDFVLKEPNFLAEFRGQRREVLSLCLSNISANRE